MVTRRAQLALLVLLGGALTTPVATAQPSAPTALAGILHVPPAGGTAGRQLELVAEAPPTAPTLAAHVRRQGEATFERLELTRRPDGSWVAVVPSRLATQPALEYYLTAGDAAVFATAQAPHALLLTADHLTERRQRDLHRAHGHRSRIHVGAEWVDYGTTKIRFIENPTELVDRYYRIDADFSYRLLTYPLEEIRVGYTRLLGKTQSSLCSELEPCTGEAGYKVGGWFELGLAPVEGLRFDVRLLVLATQSGFKVGGRAEVRAGVLEGNHVALGAETMADVGQSAHFRLGWGTVPRLPMAATVEITRLPDGDRDTGVRLFYDVMRAVGPNLHLGLRAGFAARNQQTAGYTLGANALVDF